VRDREAEGLNAALNYGYTILRSATARLIVAMGLHPSVSLKHRRDPMALTDDLMEPFRPVVDVHVLELSKVGPVSPEIRIIREVLVERINRCLGPLEYFIRSIAHAYLTVSIPSWKAAKKHVTAGIL
jgi:CRISPR associated protein Cas1